VIFLPYVMSFLTLTVSWRARQTQTHGLQGAAILLVVMFLIVSVISVLRAQKFLLLNRFSLLFLNGCMLNPQIVENY